MKIYCAAQPTTIQRILDRIVGTDIWIRGDAAQFFLPLWLNIIREDGAFYYARTWPYRPDVSLPITLVNFPVSELSTYVDVARIRKDQLQIYTPVEMYKTSELFQNKGDKS